MVYGGALHNDLLPVPELAPFTFGSAVRARVGQGQYLEVDLYVPEYVQRNRRIQREPWFRAYQRLARERAAGAGRARARLVHRGATAIQVPPA